MPADMCPMPCPYRGKIRTPGRPRGTSQTNSSEITPEVLDHWDDVFDPELLYLSDFPKKCPNVKWQMVICPRAYPTSNEYGCDLLYRVDVVNMTCKKWSCSVCAKKKVSIIQLRAMNGPLVQEPHRLIKMGKQYPVKMFHLTLPGTSWRYSHTIVESVDIIRKNWNKLRTALQKQYGKFHYLCTVEPQQDGWPHLHVLVVSEKMADSKPLKFVKRLWEDKYKMGYAFVTVKNKGKKKLIRDARQGILYATKYMWKGLENFGQ